MNLSAAPAPAPMATLRPGVYGMPARPAAAAVPRGQPASPYATQAARYRDAELASASPGQLVVLLFDKLALTVRRARVALEARDIEQRTEQILKAAEMVTELRVSLDHEQGGAMSGQLDALYAFMLRELHEANRTQDAGKLDVVLRIAGELREGFAGALTQLQGTPHPAVQARSA